jgi:signal transduction histidine kinase
MSVGSVSMGTLDITERQRLDDRLKEAFRSLREAADEGERLLDALIEAQERERRRIVRDIHDDPLQLMTAIGTRLSSLRQTAPSVLREELAELENLARQAISRVRRVMVDPSPPGLDRLRLLPTLLTRMHQMRMQDGVECVLRNRLGGEPPMEAGLVLLRVAVEALTNVSNHAEASLVEVCLENRDGGVLLRIRDDGRGFNLDQAAERPGHVGLGVMRERAELAGGSLRMEAAPGKGTTVECWIPESASKD